MKRNPKISIVTPSFNHGQFLEETILSVLAQGYNNLEYIIIDGGSTDNTIEIIKKYESNIDYWISEPDQGQSDAINKGLKLATGDILGWLNSDDLYMPGCLKYISETVDLTARTIYFGNCIHFKSGNDGVVAYGSNVEHAVIHQNLAISDFIIQPSSFWTRETWNLVGNLCLNKEYVFDWEWFLRAKSLGVSLQPLKKHLSLYRIHSNQKSSIGGGMRQLEIMNLYNTYSPKHTGLYKKLANETVNNKSLSYRFLYVILKLSKFPHRYTDVLKILKYRKYRTYSSQEVFECNAML